MSKMKVNDKKLHKQFIALNRKHILMITNHGIHQWKVIPGLQDTGGQNVFVNSMTASLAKQGFKITIVNRGGYKHPETGAMRTGIHYKDKYQRILFIEDSTKEFVRKEDMNDRIPELTDFLCKQLDREQIGIDLIVSHYWDAGKIGMLIQDRIPCRAKHVWVTHSLGALKKKQVKQERWAELRIDERIEEERKILKKVDFAGYTSYDLKKCLEEDYGYKDGVFLPPCIDTERYHPRELPKGEEIWDFFDKKTPLSEEDIRRRCIITEISRTDTTKRKDVLIKAFAKAHASYPRSVLLLSIDESRTDIAGNLFSLIEDLGITKDVIVVGSVWDELPEIYAASSIYCTPSVMEGFGMSAQEAAATEIPVVSSDLVPFVVGFLVGDEYEEIPLQDKQRALKKGAGGIVAPADNVDAFAEALLYLLEHREERLAMGERAYEITIPKFTWHRMIRDFLKAIGFSLPGIMSEEEEKRESYNN